MWLQMVHPKSISGRIPKINDGKLQNHDTKIGDPITNFEELVPSWCGTGATWQCSSRTTSRVLNGDFFFWQTKGAGSQPRQNHHGVTTVAPINSSPKDRVG